MLLLGAYPLPSPTSPIHQTLPRPSAPSPHPIDGPPGGPRCPDTGPGYEWLQGWQERVGQAAGPPGGQQAPRRGRCCRQLPGDREPQQLAYVQPGAGCSAGAVDSAVDLHGRCPVAHLVWGQDRRECQAMHLKDAAWIYSPILSVPPTYNIQNPLESGKVPLPPTVRSDVGLLYDSKWEETVF